MCALHTNQRRAAAFQGPVLKLPWDAWTWQHPLGRSLSAVLGAGAVSAAVLLGGLGTWTFWVGLLAPDIALFYDARNGGPEQGQLSPRAARLYNALHHPAAALAVLAVGAATLNQPLLVAGLGWFTHIALDRALRFGPRRPDGRFHENPSRSRRP